MHHPKTPTATIQSIKRSPKRSQTPSPPSKKENKKEREIISKLCEEEKIGLNRLFFLCQPITV